MNDINFALLLTARGFFLYLDIYLVSIARVDNEYDIQCVLIWILISLLTSKVNGNLWKFTRSFCIRKPFRMLIFCMKQLVILY